MTEKYKYKGLPLTPKMVSELALSIFSGKTVKRQKIADDVMTSHLEQGGKPPEVKNFTASIKRALDTLRKHNGVENPSTGFWRFPAPLDQDFSSQPESEPAISLEESTFEPKVEAEKIIGKGANSVYVYFYSTYKKHSELTGKKYWPCKIGLSERDPLVRVFSQSGTALPEVPVVGLLIKTDKASTVEKVIHFILDLRGRRSTSAPGTEWFDTTPSEVESILRFCGVAEEGQ